MFYQKDLNQVSNIEVASYWYETKKFNLENENENTLKDMAVCYFRICEAAGVGSFIMGRRGQPTRLEINKDLLGQYIGGSTLSKADRQEADFFNAISENEAEIPDTVQEDDPVNMSVDYIQKQAKSIDEAIRIFISHGKNMDIVEQIKTLIDLANLDYEVVVESETAAIPIPEKVFNAMHRCNSAVICVSADENEKKEDGSYGINQNVLIEIGSAFVLYDKKVILVWDKRISIPSNLQGLYRCEYTGDELSWGTGIKLMKALNEFKKK
jgi:predicted nucleotide-binding protein